MFKIAYVVDNESRRVRIWVRVVAQVVYGANT